jgi:hypothetical protein
LKGINELAIRMQRVRDEVQTVVQIRELRNDAEVFDSLSDIVDAINEKLTGWMESVEFDHIAGRLWTTTVEERLKRVHRLAQARQRGGPMLAVFKKLGVDLLPIAINRLEKAKNYSRLTIDLNPLVTAALRYVAENPAFIGYSR